MGYAASHCIRIGQELSEHAMGDVVTFVREHVRDFGTLTAKVAAAVGG